MGNVLDIASMAVKEVNRPVTHPIDNSSQVQYHQTSNSNRKLKHITKDIGHLTLSKLKLPARSLVKSQTDQYSTLVSSRKVIFKTNNQSASNIKFNKTSFKFKKNSYHLIYD